MDFLDQVYFDNTLRAYIYCAAIILVAYLLKHYLSRAIAALIVALVKKKHWTIDNGKFKSMIIMPFSGFLFLLISILAIGTLKFPEDLKYQVYNVTTQQVFQGIASGILIIMFFKLVLSILEFIAILMENRANLTATQSDNQLIMFFKDFVRVVIVIIGIILVLKFSFGAHIGELLTGLSIVGAALALAARESLENLIASFIIFFDKPFTVGDFVRVQNFTGAVERIGLRSTRIRTADKNLVTVPNKQMVDSILDNHSLRTLQRMELRFELSPKTPAELIEATVDGIRKIIVSKGTVIINHTAFLFELSKNGALIVAEYFCESTLPLAEFNALRQEINLDVKRLIEEHNVEIAGVSSSVNIIEGGAPPAKSSGIL